MQLYLKDSEVHVMVKIIYCILCIGVLLSPTSSLDSDSYSQPGETESGARAQVSHADKKRLKEAARQVKLEKERVEKETKKLAKAAAKKKKKEAEKEEKKGFFSKFKKALKPSQKHTMQQALAESAIATGALAAPTTVSSEEDQWQSEYYEHIHSTYMNYTV